MPLFKTKSQTKPQAQTQSEIAAAPKQQQNLHLHAVVPCRPSPLLTFTHSRDVWVLSDKKPQQNFWNPVRPASIGLDIDDSLGLWRYGQTDSEHGPSLDEKRNVVALLGRLNHNEQMLNVGLCLNRKIGVIKGTKENAVRAVRQIQREYAHSSVGVMDRCHYADRLTSQDLQSMVQMSVECEPQKGSLVVCDLEYDSGGWSEEALKGIAETHWLSSLFYLENGSNIDGSIVWDTNTKGEICEGVKLRGGVELDRYVGVEEAPTDREPFRLTLRGEQGVLAVGMVSPALPPKGIEVLRLISVLRYAKISTDVDTLADYMEKKGRSDEVRRKTLSLLETVSDLLGTNMESNARLYEDNGNWKHSIPLDTLSRPGEDDSLEKYRWYTMLSDYISGMIKESV